MFVHTLALERDDGPRRRSRRSWREAYDTPEQWAR